MASLSFTVELVEGMPRELIELLRVLVRFRGLLGRDSFLLEFLP